MLVLLRGGAVVEDGDGAVTLAPGVVLGNEAGSWTHLEVALLAAEAPQDLAVLGVDLVDGGGSFGGDEEVTVEIYLYGVDVEVVERRSRVLRRLAVGLLDAHVIQAAPLEEHLPALEVELLGDPSPHQPLFRAPDRREVRSCLGVGRQESGVAGSDGELVQVALVAVARLDPLYLPIRAVEDHILPDAVSGHDPTLPPAEHRFTPVALHLEVRRVPVLAEPDDPSEVVDDHRTVLPCPLLRGHEDIAWCSVVRLLGYLDTRGTEIRTRAEGSYFIRPRRGRTVTLLFLLAPRQVQEREICGAGPYGAQELLSRELPAQRVGRCSVVTFPDRRQTRAQGRSTMGMNERPWREGDTSSGSSQGPLATESTFHAVAQTTRQALKASWCRRGGGWWRLRRIESGADPFRD